MRNPVTIYYSPEAAISSAGLFFQNDLGYLAPVDMESGLNGKRKRRGFLRKIGKKLKKVGKKAIKVIKKAIPIANTVLTFIPGIGWAAKAALTAVEIGINAAERAKARKKAAKEAKQVKKVNNVPARASVKPVVVNQGKNTLPKPEAKRPAYNALSYSDIATIHTDYHKKQPTADDVIDITRMVTPAADLISSLTEVKTANKQGVNRRQMKDITRAKVRANHISIY